MGERRLLDAVADRLTLGRRLRILRHRTARWFLPPVRPTMIESLDQRLRLRPLPAGPSRRYRPSLH